MSKTLTLEIPDEIFGSFQKIAETKGKTAENFVLELILKNFPQNNGSLSGQERSAALKRLLEFSGAVSSENSRSADNETIDADLAAEYGKDV